MVLFNVTTPGTATLSVQRGSPFSATAGTFTLGTLTAAVPNGAWVEYIPQLDSITTSRLAMQDGYALPPAAPGLGIEWDHAAIDRGAVSKATVTSRT